MVLIRCHNRVVLLLVLIALAASLLPFVNYAPNRLVSGETRLLWQLWPQTSWLWLVLLMALCFTPRRWPQAATLILAEGLFIALVWAAGRAATDLAQEGSALARTSMGSGLWLWMALALLAASDAIRRLTAGPALAVTCANLDPAAVSAALRLPQRSLPAERVRQPSGCL